MKSIYYLAISLFIISCNDKDPKPGTGHEGYKLVWSDEFDATIDSKNWTFELGDGTNYGLPPGWGNSEKQLYTRSGNNALVLQDDEGNSVLAITARKEPSGGFTSAKLTTQNLQSVRFGRVEARIRVPEGKGMWPAFWMLGDNRTEIDWPGCGEIDIMEVIGNSETVLHSTVHYTNSQNKRGINGKSFTHTEKLSNEYHIYSLDWTPEMMTFMLDQQVVHEIEIEADMKEFLRSFYLILNIAVGGNWPGNPDETTVFPQRMYVDWVRVYSNDNINAPAPPPLDIEEETMGFLSTTLAAVAFNTDFNEFDNLILRSFGAGGEPNFETSTEAVNGSGSLLLKFPGGNWGGAFFTQEPVVNATKYANGNLKFSLKYPAILADAEIKLESVATAKSLFLKDYTGVAIGSGFLEYTIPIADFTGLNLSELKIPFALWNPVNSAAEYVPMDILVDNIRLEE